jgi:DNA-directed RNA polymerase specialized sigma subunit
MRKIADMIGRTEGRVSQVHSQAIKRLRNWLARFKSDLMN